MLKPASLPINTKVKGIDSQKDEIVSYIYPNLPLNDIVRLFHPRNILAKGNKPKNLFSVGYAWFEKPLSKTFDLL